MEDSYEYTDSSRGQPTRVGPSALELGEGPTTLPRKSPPSEMLYRVSKLDGFFGTTYGDGCIWLRIGANGGPL